MTRGSAQGPPRELCQTMFKCCWAAGTRKPPRNASDSPANLKAEWPRVSDHLEGCRGWCLQSCMPWEGREPPPNDSKWPKSAVFKCGPPVTPSPENLNTDENRPVRWAQRLFGVTRRACTQKGGSNRPRNRHGNSGAR
jgi:hypothetical protein